MPVESAENKWTYDELFTYLTGPKVRTATPTPAAKIFAKAQCIKCHRYGERGDGIGPDLTTVSRRFQKKEILESILFPSQVISDQYASKTDLHDRRPKHHRPGCAAVGRLAHRAAIERPKSDDRRQRGRSTCPQQNLGHARGLLNPLTLEDIANLFAYLNYPPGTSVTSRRAEPVVGRK